MTKPTVRRKDIELREQVEYSNSLVKDAREGVTVQWTANLEGRLSTGEYVEMYRSGLTANAALETLKTAIEEQGWRVND